MFDAGSLNLLQAGLTQAMALAAVPVQFRDQHMRSEDGQASYVCVASNALLLTHAGPNEDQVILCDSGAGEHVPPKLRAPGSELVSLERSLQSIGLSREGIDTYILGHGHWDHSGGAFDVGGKFLLPKATVVMSRGALEEIRSSEGKPSFVRGLAAELDRLEAGGRLIIVDVDSSSLSGKSVAHPHLGNGIALYASGGHAEQLHPAFQVGDKTVVHMGDLVSTSWHAQSSNRFMPQFDPAEGRERLLAEKEAALRRFADEGALLLYYHDAVVAASHVRATREPKVYEIYDVLQWSPV